MYQKNKAQKHRSRCEIIYLHLQPVLSVSTVWNRSSVRLPVLQRSKSIADGLMRSSYLFFIAALVFMAYFSRRCSPQAEIIDRLNRISARFSILTQHNIRGYANSVYHEYLQTITPNQPKGQRSLIEDAILPISAFEQDILGYEHVILNSTGVGREMCYLQKALRPIRELVGWLEEMLCEAMISPKGLRDKYDRGDLAFLTL